MTAPIAFASPVPAAAAPSGASAASASSDSGFSFHDLLSIVNPLQHIPIVSTIYRAITGDRIGPVERIAGDTLYGGFWGFVSSVANVAFQEITGKDLGDTALAFLEGGDNGKTAVAAATPSASTSIPAVASKPTDAGYPMTAPTAIASSAVSGTNANLWVANGPPRALQARSTLAAVARAPANPMVFVSTPVSSANGISVARIANGPPRLLQPHVTLSGASGDSAATLALIDAMDEKGIDPALGQRALSAYRRSIAASPAGAAPPI